MRIAIIINPFAGRGRRDPRGAARADEAARLARQAGVQAEIAVTDGPGHGADLARTFVAAGYEVVAAWGGDGTINEVAGPLIGTRVKLAVVPSGSGDGLARGLRLPIRAADAFRAAISGASAAIDVGYLGSRHFLNIGGIGFDADVAVAFGRSGRYGALSYAAEALTCAWSYRCQAYRVSLDGVDSAGPRFLVAFANSRQYGNGLILAPDADPADGRLNAVLVGGGSALRQLWRARRLFVSPLKPAEGLTRSHVRTASVFGESLVCHVDGEPFEACGRLDVRIERAAIQIVGLHSAGAPSRPVASGPPV